jgi:anti-sigma-K factor RskA
MTIREIIESGIIELYVMNALPAEEAAQVEAWAAEFPEVHAEIEANQLALENYAQHYAQTPRPELKDAILARFEADKSTGNTENEVDSDLKSTQNTPLSKNHFLGLRPADWAWVITALTVIGFIFMAVRNATLRHERDNCQTENQRSLAQKDSIIEDLRQKLNIIRNPTTRTVVMTEKGTPSKTPAQVVVYWNAKAYATFLAISNLPAPPKGKQYQLWAIVKGKPVDAGVFDYDLAAIQPMKLFDEAQAFAVTLENEGGSPSPTLEQMYVVGSL